MITIAITRPEDSASELKSGLEMWGVRVVVVPTIARHSLLSPEELRQLQLRLRTYDWVLLTSPYAVQGLFKNSAGVANAAKKVGEKSEGMKSPSPRWAVVGEATGRALNDVGVSVDCMPSQFTASHLAQALGDLKDQRLLIPRSRIGDRSWVDGLRRRGALVEDVPLYDTVPRALSDEDWLSLGASDALVFASGSAVKSLVDQGVQKGQTLPSTKQAVFCIGPSTAKAAESLGIEVSAVASPHTGEGLLRVISEHYSRLLKG